MRQILLMLALVGAIVSGWVPAMTATLAAAQPTGMHAMHDTTGEDDGREEGKSHPIACSACFAIEAERLETPDRLSEMSSHIPAATPQLAGLARRPLDPPPRS